MDCSLEGNFTQLKTNPAELILLVDKHVRVQLIKNSLFNGFVHSIDPMSCSIILSVPQADGYKTVLLPGHAILNIEEIKPINNISPPIRKSVMTSTFAPEIVLRKEKVIAWLKHNLLPVSEHGENIVLGNASLLPPYGVPDICTTNPMVAIEVRKTLEAMPKDFKPK